MDSVRLDDWMAEFTFISMNLVNCSIVHVLHGCSGKNFENQQQNRMLKKYTHVKCFRILSLESGPLQPFDILDNKSRTSPQRSILVGTHSIFERLEKAQLTH